MARITSEAQLRDIYGEARERSVRKQLSHVDPHVRRFIGLSPFCLIASTGADGLGDVTPRGDAPGFVAVLDDNTLALPDRPGNRRLDTLTNILKRPGIGMIFLIPGVNETLRVNGLGEIRDDQHLRDRFVVDGKEPATVLVIYVREAYIHCAKALMRSRLWAPEVQVDRGMLPTMGQMMKDHAGLDGEPEPDDAMLERYADQLY